MQTDILIIGQGICGTMLSWHLQNAGVSYLVIDDPRPHTPSKAAAGLINPVTGRRLVTTWMIDELLPYVEECYAAIGKALQIDCLSKRSLIDFFPSPQMRLAFLDRYKEDAAYLRLPADQQVWDEHFHYELGYGSIDPCYILDLPALLDKWRQQLIKNNQLREEHFDISQLQTKAGSLEAGSLEVKSIEANSIEANSIEANSIETNNIEYKDISASKIIFCDGGGSFDNPYFSRLPFAPNKGEALILDIPGLPPGIYKKGMTLAPWRNDLFWIGSSYQWSFENDLPTESFRQKTEATLREWLKHEFRIVEHIASVRPATLERRPFVGFHPTHRSIGILNGMGAKGCSLAPWFARQLTANITTGTALQPDADVKRFTKILSR